MLRSIVHSNASCRDALPRGKRQNLHPQVRSFSDELPIDNLKTPTRALFHTVL